MAWLPATRILRYCARGISSEFRRYRSSVVDKKTALNSLINRFPEATELRSQSVLDNQALKGFRADAAGHPYFGQWLTDFHRKHPWGPQRHPAGVHESLNMDRINCGMAQFLAHQGAEAGGHPCCSVQMILLGTPSELAIWSKMWQTKELIPDWIEPPFYYHETLGLLSNSGELQICDDLCWYLPAAPGDHELKWGSVVQLRVSKVAHTHSIPPLITYGGWKVEEGQWRAVVPNDALIPDALDFAALGKPVVLVSSVDCSANPHAGLSVAQCLRQAFGKDICLIGVDTSPHSTGLHSEHFDENLLIPKEADATLFCQWLLDMLQNVECALYIPLNDIEIRKLSQMQVTSHLHVTSVSRKLLVPPLQALTQTSKEHLDVMGFCPPQTLQVDITSNWQQEADDFAFQVGYPVMVKGENYGAELARNRKELVVAVQRVARQWKSSKVLLQESVQGLEESIAFCALDGVLLGAARMKKTTVKEGKSWGGRVSKLPPGEAESLTRLVSDLNWSGGGEIEMIKEINGKSRPIDFNPRFPAWIYGLALGGLNLPAILVGKMLGLDIPPECLQIKPGHADFTRITQEVPTRRIAASAKPGLGQMMGAGGKTDARFQLVSDMNDIQAIESTPPYLDHKLSMVKLPNETPTRVWIPGELERVVHNIKKNCDDYGIEPCMSIKTRPDTYVFETCRESGYLAEAINGNEIAAAIQHGFSYDSIVLNGPGKLQNLKSYGEPLLLVCADSVADLKAIVKRCQDHRLQTKHVGFRISAPGQNSRFGIDMLSDEAHELTSILADLPGNIGVAVHFHHASSSIGIQAWLKAVKSILGYTKSILEHCSRSLQIVDLGGGWPSGQLEDKSSESFTAICHAADHVRNLFGQEVRVMIEPGKALTERSGLLVCGVQQLRETQGGQAAIIDGGINDLPDLSSHPHPLYWSPAGGDGCGDWSALTPGKDLVYGRICMEDDQLSTVSLPPQLRTRDFIAIANCGAYDGSMSYSFVHGGGRQSLQDVASSEHGLSEAESVQSSLNANQRTPVAIGRVDAKLMTQPSLYKDAYCKLLVVWELVGNTKAAFISFLSVASGRPPPELDSNELDKLLNWLKTDSTLRDDYVSLVRNELQPRNKRVLEIIRDLHTGFGIELARVHQELSNHIAEMDMLLIKWADNNYHQLHPVLPYPNDIDAWVHRQLEAALQEHVAEVSRHVHT